MDTRLVIDPTDPKDLSQHNELIMDCFIKQKPNPMKQKWTGKWVEASNQVKFTRLIVWRQKLRRTQVLEDIYYVLGAALSKNTGKMNEGIYPILGKLRIIPEQSRIDYCPVSGQEKERLIKVEEIKIDMLDENIIENLKKTKERMAVPEQVPDFKARSFSYFKNAETQVFFLKIKTFSGITLTEFLERFGGESSEKHFLLSIHFLSRLASLHQAGIIHRDIKPDNVIVDPDTLGIAFVDFDTAKVRGQDGRWGYSLSYAAPETAQAVLNKQGFALITEKADMFSAGLVLTQIWGGKSRTGFSIEQCAGDQGLPSEWADLDHVLKKWADLETSSQMLIKKAILDMTQLHPHARPSAEKMLLDFIQLAIHHLDGEHKNGLFQRYQTMMSFRSIIQLPITSSDDWKKFYHDVMTLTTQLVHPENAPLLPLLTALPAIQAIRAVAQKPKLVKKIISDYLKLDKQLSDAITRLKTQIAALKIISLHELQVHQTVIEIETCLKNLQDIQSTHALEHSFNIMELKHYTDKMNKIILEFDEYYERKYQQISSRYQAPDNALLKNIILLSTLLRRIDKLIYPKKPYSQELGHSFKSINMFRHQEKMARKITLTHIQNGLHFYIDHYLNKQQSLTLDQISAMEDTLSQCMLFSTGTLSHGAFRANTLHSMQKFKPSFIERLSLQSKDHHPLYFYYESLLKTLDLSQQQTARQTTNDSAYPPDVKKTRPL